MLAGDSSDHSGQTAQGRPMLFPDTPTTHRPGCLSTSRGRLICILQESLLSFDKIAKFRRYRIALKMLHQFLQAHQHEPCFGLVWDRCPREQGWPTQAPAPACPCCILLKRFFKATDEYIAVVVSDIFTAEKLQMLCKPQ